MLTLQCSLNSIQMGNSQRKFRPERVLSWRLNQPPLMTFKFGVSRKSCHHDLTTNKGLQFREMDIVHWTIEKRQKFFLFCQQKSNRFYFINWWTTNSKVWRQIRACMNTHCDSQSVIQTKSCEATCTCAARQYKQRTTYRKSVLYDRLSCARLNFKKFEFCLQVWISTVKILCVTHCACIVIYSEASSQAVCLHWSSRLI